MQRHFRHAPSSLITGSGGTSKHEHKLPRKDESDEDTKVMKLYSSPASVEMKVRRIEERMERAWTLMGCSDCKETPKNLLVSLNIPGDSLEGVALIGLA